MKLRLAQLIAPFLFASALGATPQGAVSIFVQQDDVSGSIYVYDEHLGSRYASPPELRDLRLLELDFVGRTEVDEFLPERPRYKTDVPSASRLSLPQGQGSLYRYVRTPSLRERLFGFLRVDPTGRTSILLELPGAGRTGLEDPWQPRISVAPDGRGMLVATRLNAGGDLYQVEFDGETLVRNRTTDLPPMLFRTGGLGLQRDWGAAVTQRGILRLRRHSDAPIEILTIAGGETIDWYQGDLVFSLNGRHAVTVGGEGEDAANLWAFSRTGSVVRVSERPMRLSCGGFLPEHRNGPYLAVSDDGRLAAWRSDTEQRELFLGKVPNAHSGLRDARHVTRQQLFDETLDEIGLTRFYIPDRVTFAAGARDYVHAGLDRADMFSAALNSATQTLEVRNVSLTSGERQPPFIEYGTLEPQSVTWVPSANRLLIYDDEQNDALYAVRPGGLDAKLLLRGVRALDLLTPTHEGLLVGVRRTDVAGGRSQLLRFDRQLQARPMLVVEGMEDEVDFSRAAARRDGWVSFVTTENDSQTLSRVDMATGELEDIAVTYSSSFGPAIGYNASGAAIFSLTGSGVTATFLWPLEEGDIVQFASPLVGNTGFLLPGI